MSLFYFQLTTILLNGQKSGVLGNVDPFELEVSKNKVRLLEKRQEEKEKRHQAEICDKNLTTDNLQNKEITGTPIFYTKPRSEILTRFANN